MADLLTMWCDQTTKTVFVQLIQFETICRHDAETSVTKQTNCIKCGSKPIYYTTINHTDVNLIQQVKIPEQLPTSMGKF